VKEFFVVANSFAAPFCSDQSTHYATGATPPEALDRFARKEYKHPAGLYAAEIYDSADGYHKGRNPLARWLSNHAWEIELRKPTMICSNGPGKLELDGVTVEIKDPKHGAVRP
jgi:hypothetical protein